MARESQACSSGREGAQALCVTTDLSTLLTALYVRIDDYLAARVRPGRPPRLTDSELLTLATTQVLLGVHSETRWLRLVPQALPGAFPYLPGQSGYNKRLRAALPLLKRIIRVLAADTDLWSDPVWLVDSTPVECARSRPTALRSDLAGVAGYGYCPSHTRWFWGLRLHLICTGPDPPAHRVGLRHPQRPAGPRITRRAQPRGCDRPSRPTAAGPDRGDLAQPRHRPAHHPIPDRLRPLIEIELTHLVLQPHFHG
jgi:hypothetical protein